MGIIRQQYQYGLPTGYLQV